MTVILINMDGICFLLLQAASALHAMYKKFPVLYNSSIVSSFEPKVIYKVTQIQTNLDKAETEMDFWFNRDVLY